MRSIALIVPALLVLGLAAPHAEAQIGTPVGQTTPTGTGTNVGNGTTTGSPYGGNIESVTIGENGSDEKIRKKGSSTRATINLKECEQYYDFTFTTMPRTPILELWVSRDGTDCSQTSARAQTTTTGQTACWFVTRTDGVVQGKNVTLRNVPGLAIFNYNRAGYGSNNANPPNLAEHTSCSTEAASDSPYYLWFVPLSAPTVSNTASPSQPIYLPYRIRFNLFTSLPTVPPNVEAHSGESAVRATWDSNGDVNANYRAYFAVDNGGMDGGVCGVTFKNADGGTLAGTEVPVDDVSVFATGKTGKTSSALKLSDKPFDAGTNFAVAVAAEDLAGNIGLLSSPQCVQRVYTISAIDACREDGMGKPEDCGLDTCSLSSSNGSWFGLSLFVLALSALIRRRTA